MKQLFTTTLLVLSLCGSLVAQEFKFGEVSLEALSQTEHPNHKDADAAILYRKSKTDFKYSADKGFYAIIEREERIKIYNKEGLNWATVSIPLYKGNGSKDDKITGIKAFTYNAIDGSIVEDKLSSDGIFDEEKSEYLDIKRFTMPNVKDGSIIEFKYTISTPYIGNLDPIYFQETIPVDKVEMEFWAPEYLMYKSHIRGWYPIAIEETSKKDRVRLSYRVAGDKLTGGARNRSETVDFMSNGYLVNLKNVAPIYNEPYMSSLDNYRGGVQFELNFTKFPNQPIESYATSWEVIAQEINDSRSFGVELGKGRFFSNLLGNILNGSEAEGEKIAKIFAFVRSNTVWNGSKGVYAQFGVEKSLEDKSGNVADINLLLVGLLREAGIQANPVLLSSKENGIPIFPTRNGFDYVVAGIGPGNNPLLLDASDKLSAPQILKDEVLNWKGRLITEDNTSYWVNLLPKKVATHTALISLNITEDSELMIDSKNRYTGHLAQNLRNTYLPVDENQQRLQFEKNNGQLPIEKIEFKNLDNLAKPVSLSYTAESDQMIEEAGGKVYISPLANYAIETNPFVAERRSYPIDFKYPTHDKYTVNITIPEGYKVSALPESVEVALAEGVGRYKYFIKQIGSKIQLSVQRELNASVIGSDSYTDIKDYFQFIVEKESEKIVLDKI